MTLEIPVRLVSVSNEVWNFNPEVDQWIDDNLSGRPNLSVNRWSEQQQSVMVSWIEVMVAFRNPNDALFFKLAWF